MLEIALCPAAIAHGNINQAGRTSLVGSGEVGLEPHLPSGAAKICSLNEVVALDGAAQRRPAGKNWQSRGFGKGSRANDGVVTPVVAAALMPGCEAGGYDRAIEGHGKLLETRKQRA